MASTPRTPRRGLPRVPGGEPWPPAGSDASGDASPRTPGGVRRAARISRIPPRGKRTTRRTPSCRRRMPRAPARAGVRGHRAPRASARAGGEPWPPASLARPTRMRRPSPHRTGAMRSDRRCRRVRFRSATPLRRARGQRHRLAPGPPRCGDGCRGRRCAPRAPRASRAGSPGPRHPVRVRGRQRNRSGVTESGRGRPRLRRRCPFPTGGRNRTLAAGCPRARSRRRALRRERPERPLHREWPERPLHGSGRSARCTGSGRSPAAPGGAGKTPAPGVPGTTPAPAAPGVTARLLRPERRKPGGARSPRGRRPRALPHGSPDRLARGRGATRDARAPAPP